MERGIAPRERTHPRWNPVIWAFVTIAMIWVAVIVADELGFLPLGRVPVLSLPILAAFAVAGVVTFLRTGHQHSLDIQQQAKDELVRADLLMANIQTAQERLGLRKRDDPGRHSKLPG